MEISFVYKAFCLETSIKVRGLLTRTTPPTEKPRPIKTAYHFFGNTLVPPVKSKGPLLFMESPCLRLAYAHGKEQGQHVSPLCVGKGFLLRKQHTHKNTGSFHT